MYAAVKSLARSRDSLVIMLLDFFINSRTMHDGPGRRRALARMGDACGESPSSFVYIADNRGCRRSPARTLQQVAHPHFRPMAGADVVDHTRL